MITTRDIKVFIFSIFITTLCLALFKQPIKEAEAQGGGICQVHAQKAKEIHNDTYDLLQAHVNGAVAKHGEMLGKLDTLLAR